MQDLARTFVHSNYDRSSSSVVPGDVKRGYISDEEERRVPEIGREIARTSMTVPRTSTIVGVGEDQVFRRELQKKRGRNQADKEAKRLKRLLRNRVSAQQARERKKVYLNDLEAKVCELEKKNTDLEEKISTLQNENQMLRHILKNTTTSSGRGTKSPSGG